jgi:hypothetical protein
MNEVCENGVRTIPAQAVPSVPVNHATTFILQFEAEKNLLAKYTAPRRPNRNRPTTPLEDHGDIAASRIAASSSERVSYGTVRKELGL